MTPALLCRLRRSSVRLGLFRLRNKTDPLAIAAMTKIRIDMSLLTGHVSAEHPGRKRDRKNNIAANLIVQHLAAGDGVGVIDLHGDLAEELLNHIPLRPSNRGANVRVAKEGGCCMIPGMPVGRTITTF